MMKIGCNSVAFRKSTLEFALEKIAAAGYEYVEVEANLSWCPHVDPWKTDPIEFKDMVKKFGFKGVSAIGSHRELITQQQGVMDIEQALKWCHAADVPAVLTGEGRKPEDMSNEDALKILRERLTYLAEVAEKNKVNLLMEDHGSISLSSLEGLPKIVSLVESDWLGVNLDTANIRRGDYVGTDRGGYEWKLGQVASHDEVELTRRVAKKVKHLHFKDVVGRDATILGQGEINLMGCLQVLKNVGFEGVLSYETEGMQEPDESVVMIGASKKYMEDALKSLYA
jgi:L-ribulose-5-phosphate 3-epimerase